MVEHQLIQSFKMAFKLTILALVAFIACTVMAENGQITDPCPPCKRLVDDFTPELKTESVQKVYERTCDDVFLEDPDTNKLCRDNYDHLFTEIRNALNNGKTSEDICNGLGACGEHPSQRQKFVKLQKQHKLFRGQLSKLF